VPASCWKTGDGHSLSERFNPENHVTPVAAVCPDLSRVPPTVLGPPEGKERSHDEECPRPESLCTHPEVTTVVAVHPYLSRVPQASIGQNEGKGRRCDEECPGRESPLGVSSGQCTPGLTLDNQVSGHASGVTSGAGAASGAFTSPQKYIPPHLRNQVKPPGGCPGKTTPPSVRASGACLGETTTAFVRVTPKPEAQLEADESIYALT
jgi:hypothetical protein